MKKQKFRIPGTTIAVKIEAMKRKRRKTATQRRQVAQVNQKKRTRRVSQTMRGWGEIMYQERTNRGSAGLVVIVVLAFIALAMWWLESRFNATVAIMVIGSLVGAGLVIVGFVLNMASTKYTLNSAVDFNRSIAETEKYRQLTQREQARGDTHWHRANAQISVLDARRIDQIAQQRAGLLIDERQQPQADAWAWDNDDAGNDWNTMG